MVRLALPFAAIALAAAAPARAEQLTIAVSTPEVHITSNFNGVGITVFGVIERDAAAVSRVGRYEVAVLVLGPTQTIVARRKDRMAGIWFNTASETIVAAPTFYALNASTGIEMAGTPVVLERLALGFDNIPFTFRGRDENNSAQTAEFRDAFLRLKERAGLFSEDAGVEFIGDTIFRSTTLLPANIPVGRYAVLAYLFSGQSLVAHAEDTIVVSQTGIEQTVNDFAHEHALIYGLLCAALAVFVGWLGGVIFRRD